MTEREKKFTKLLGVLIPALLLAVWYGYSQIQDVKARREARIKKAQQDAQEAQQANAIPAPPSPAAAPAAAAPASPLPASAPVAAHVPAPAAASPAVLVFAVDTAAQKARLLLPWGRDPFAPPDTQGPEIALPANMESPRGKNVVELRIQISDHAAGNSGVASAVLFFGSEPPNDAQSVPGVAPASADGDGLWTFAVPAPKDKPVGCFIAAVDRSRLRNQTRSGPFTISPPARESVKAASGGAEVALTLRAVSWTPRGGVALINGDVLAQGETIQGYKVIQITRNSVTLRRGDDEILLQMKE